MNKTLIAAAAGLSGAMLASCAMDIPKTREFTGHRDIKKDTYTVPRKLE